ncbi:hypothetical protein Rs2_30403 [Raphanus sativus]|nr:hypothetical protein Rs2_30403 [Raphanus sativus]
MEHFGGEDQLVHEDDELEIDIMLFILEKTTRACVLKNKRIERPMRQPITKIGYNYIQNALKEDPEHFRQVYRMYPSVFVKLCHLIKEKTPLRDTRQICLEEMVATFLLTIGQNSRYSYTMDTLNRSKFTASTNFHKVLKALNSIAPSLMAKPGLIIPSTIRESTRNYPYFKVLFDSKYIILNSIDTS